MLIAAIVIVLVVLGYTFAISACRASSSADEQSDRMFAEYMQRKNAEQQEQLTLF